MPFFCSLKWAEKHVPNDIIVVYISIMNICSWIILLKNKTAIKFNTLIDKHTSLSYLYIFCFMFVDL